VNAYLIMRWTRSADLTHALRMWWTKTASSTLSKIADASEGSLAGEPSNARYVDDRPPDQEQAQIGAHGLPKSAPMKNQEPYELPSCSSRLLDLLNPDAEQQERALEFLRELTSDRWDTNPITAENNERCNLLAQGAGR
jgi:hypothetical protein